MLDFEKNVNKKLASDDFDDIAEAITPKTLGACSTNTLLKAFEVCGYYIVGLMCATYFKVETVTCI